MLQDLFEYIEWCGQGEEELSSLMVQRRSYLPRRVKGPERPTRADMMFWPRCGSGPAAAKGATVLSQPTHIQEDPCGEETLHEPLAHDRWV